MGSKLARILAILVMSFCALSCSDMILCDDNVTTEVIVTDGIPYYYNGSVSYYYYGGYYYYPRYYGGRVRYYRYVRPSYRHHHVIPPHRHGDGHSHHGEFRPHGPRPNATPSPRRPHNGGRRH